MIPVAQRAAWAPAGPGIVGHHRSTTLAGHQESLVGENRQRMLQRRHRNVLQGAHLPDRRERLTRREHPGAGPPQSDLPTRQRVSPGVDTYAERTAG